MKLEILGGSGRGASVGNDSGPRASKRRRAAIVAAALVVAAGVVGVPQTASAAPSGCSVQYNTWTGNASGHCAYGYGAVRQVVRCQPLVGSAYNLYTAWIAIGEGYRSWYWQFNCNPPNSATTYVQTK